MLGSISSSVAQLEQQVNVEFERAKLVLNEKLAELASAARTDTERTARGFVRSDERLEEVSASVTRLGATSKLLSRLVNTLEKEAKRALTELNTDTVEMSERLEELEDLFQDVDAGRVELETRVVGAEAGVEEMAGRMDEANVEACLLSASEEVAFRQLSASVVDIMAQLQSLKGSSKKR